MQADPPSILYGSQRAPCDSDAGDTLRPRGGAVNAGPLCTNNPSADRAGTEEQGVREMGPCTRLLCRTTGTASMHRKLAIITVLTALGVIGAGSALAGKPSDPGCFGQDRAAYIETVALPDATAPGGSEVGHILAERAATNGDQNRAYMVDCGGAPRRAKRSA